MKIDILASGSKGNCIALTSGEHTILIDAGIAKTKIEKRLLDVGVRPHHIQAILVTHAHGDHIKGLPLANKYRIPVWASKGEWQAISGVDDELRFIADTTYGVYDIFELGGLVIMPFGVHHDAYEPLGYTIEDIRTQERACVVFDTGKVDADMLESMTGCNTYIIESNHEPDMVAEGGYPDSIKARILSDLGHLSNEQTAAALQQLIQGEGERIILTHLSSHNNLPTLAEMTVRQALQRKGFKPDRDFTIQVITD